MSDLIDPPKQRAIHSHMNFGTGRQSLDIIQIMEFAVQASTVGTAIRDSRF